MPIRLPFVFVVSLLIASGCASSGPTVEELPVLSEATGLEMLPRGAWDAEPPVREMRPHDPQRITIHHTATYHAPDRPIEEKMRSLQQFSQREDSLSFGRMKPVWADVPYHLYIDVHGQIAEGREVGYAGDTNTGYDPAGHVLIVLEGNFEEEQPTVEQLTALHRSTRVLASHWNIPAERIAAHRDFADTRCPGQHLYDYLPELRTEIAEASDHE